MGQNCRRNAQDDQLDSEDVDRTKKDIKLIAKKKDEDNSKKSREVIIDVAVSDVDQDVSSSKKPSLIGMHRGSSMMDGKYPSGTIVSDSSMNLVK